MEFRICSVHPSEKQPQNEMYFSLSSLTKGHGSTLMVFYILLKAILFFSEQLTMVFHLILLTKNSICAHNVLKSFLMCKNSNLMKPSIMDYGNQGTNWNNILVKHAKKPFLEKEIILLIVKRHIMKLFLYIMLMLSNVPPAIWFSQVSKISYL